MGTGVAQVCSTSLQMVDPNATEGDTANEMAPFWRRASRSNLFPSMSSIFQSRVARKRSADVAGRAYGRTRNSLLPQVGPFSEWLSGLGDDPFVRSARCLPKQTFPEQSLSFGKCLILIVPMVLLPPIFAVSLSTDILPIPCADYLVFTPACVRRCSTRPLADLAPPHRHTGFSGTWHVVACLRCICFTMDRYAEIFLADWERIWIIAAMANRSTRTWWPIPP